MIFSPIHQKGSMMRRQIPMKMAAGQMNPRPRASSFSISKNLWQKTAVTKIITMYPMMQSAVIIMVGF